MSEKFSQPSPDIDDQSEGQENPPETLDLQTADWTEVLAKAPVYKKFGEVHAQIAQGGESIQTVLADGTVETTNTANPGDVIVTNPGGERYIIGANKFNSRYEATDEEGIFRAKGKARIAPNPTGRPIRIVAPWGEEQFGGPDALIVTAYDPNNPGEVGNDRYIIGRDEFNKTYVPDTYEDDKTEAWNKAHDENYAQEGKYGLLKEARTAEAGEAPINQAEAIDYLYEAYVNGENVTATFNGEPMNSREIGEMGVDAAYEKYFGYNRQDFWRHEHLKDKALRAQHELEEFEEICRAIKKVPELLKRSAGLVRPEIATGKWEEFLKSSAEGWYYGRESQAMVKLMEAHSQGASAEELNKIIDEQAELNEKLKDPSNKHQTKERFRRSVLGYTKSYYKDGDGLVRMLKELQKTP